MFDKERYVYAATSVDFINKIYKGVKNCCTTGGKNFKKLYKKKIKQGKALFWFIVNYCWLHCRRFYMPRGTFFRRLESCD